MNRTRWIEGGRGGSSNGLGLCERCTRFTHEAAGAVLKPAT